MLFSMSSLFQVMILLELCTSPPPPFLESCQLHTCILNEMRYQVQHLYTVEPAQVVTRLRQSPAYGGHSTVSMQHILNYTATCLVGIVAR